MRLSSPLVALAGSTPARATVNSAFHWYARRRTQSLAEADPVAVQRRTLLDLLHKARDTRFGRDHGFGTIRSVEEFQARVPLRTYEDLWNAYLKEAYPVLDDVTWPGRIPFFALTSGTTQGATKYIPVSREMVASNKKAGFTMLAYHMATHPQSKLFHGRHFFLGGSSDLEQPAPGVRQGDLSGIAAEQLVEVLRPYTFPPLALALETDWDRKLAGLAQGSLRERITSVAGVPSWLLMLFQRLLDLSGKSTIAEVWPDLEMVIHGGVKFDPYRRSFEDVLGSPSIRLQETYPCSEGFIAFGDPATGLLRLMFDHGIFFEFVPVDELGSERPTRHWLGNAQIGINYAIVVSTCAGMWSHIIGDTVRFESISPPLLTFTGRTKYTLSAFGEHLISEEIEAAMAVASEATGASVREWHVGPVFVGSGSVITSSSSNSRSRRTISAASAPGSTPISVAGTPITRRTAPRGSVCPCRRSSWRSRGGSTPGCGRRGSSAASTKSRGWTARGRSRPRSPRCSATAGRSIANCRPGRPERSFVGSAVRTIFSPRPSTKKVRTADPTKTSIERSGRGLLAGDQGGDLADRVEVVDPGLVGLDGDAEAVFEEDDELERGDRVEHAAGNERGRLGQLRRVLAGQEVGEDVVRDEPADLFHRQPPCCDVGERGLDSRRGRSGPGVGEFIVSEGPRSIRAGIVQAGLSGDRFGDMMHPGLRMGRVPRRRRRGTGRDDRGSWLMTARTLAARSLCALLGLVPGLAGCQVASRHAEKHIPQFGIIDPRQPKELEMVSMPPYVVEPPDELEITVRPAVSSLTLTTFIVRSDGNVDLGFGGDVYVAGLDISVARSSRSSPSTL